jgi:hypothetical protein
MQPDWGKTNIGLKKTIELEEGFFVKDNLIQIFQLQVSFFEAIVDRMNGETRVVLNSRKPLLLSSSKDTTFADQCSGTVVIIC